jgi:hypothetical protein
MKHECKCTTCDRCGERIDKIFPKDSIFGIHLGMEIVDVKSDKDKPYLEIVQCLNKHKERFPVLVTYTGYIKKKEYELCRSCAKELKEFFKARNEEEGECDVRCNKTHCKLISD